MKMLRFVVALVIFSVVSGAKAETLTYNLKPRKIAEGVYAFIGSTDHFTVKNGGNIVNTGFIVGPEGVVIIDTGPSLKYGLEMRAAIEQITDKPIVQALITHDHPDHYLGNLAFKDLPIAALAGTIDVIRTDGDDVAEGMYRMIGDWMRGTEVVVPTATAAPGEIILAGRKLTLFALDGHTAADLAVLDEASGVLFAGDLVFHHRTPTFPSATIPRWLKSLDALGAVRFKVLVPGHGAVLSDASAIAETAAYIAWFDKTLRSGVERGLDMNEVMSAPLPSPFDGWGAAREEFIRSTTYVYPKYEAALLPRIDQQSGKSLKLD